ncbi:class I SAM-dependent methyltransferase [Streptomyces liangshanensis]|uniref:Class I SAM-dependent methyltransferase n=1 Tax=Streptomyces liangshanensis TaxID=2717324 RepID=A0A6G9H5S8_9ACTN|nr:class I SAM-dependent methyltransferase [Streptomyces liangshanensis]QIQ05883.1 class I SAM-dependent methyltransferase [Streptomyces liangshanensis]
MTDLTTGPRDLLARWDDQQAAYIAHRDQRFTSMLDVLRLHLPEEFSALDLACGPGSLADRLLGAFPRATVTAVDYDPLLLHLAGEVLAEHGGRATTLEADLLRPDWTSALGGRAFDAVVTSTALHWLSPGDLLRVYTDLAGLLPPGGLLLNADHLRFGEDAPTLRAVSARHDAECQAAAFGQGADTWDAWFTRAAARPGAAPLAAERERRFADRPPQPLAPLHFHLSALRTAGFTEVGTVWQYLDDYVVLARR